MPLKKSDKQYKFVNKPDHWYVDLIHISNDKYIEAEFESQWVILFYEPARRRIYIETLQDKGSEGTSRAFVNFMQYIEKLDD